MNGPEAFREVPVGSLIGFYDRWMAWKKINNKPYPIINIERVEAGGGWAVHSHSSLIGGSQVWWCEDEEVVP